MKCSRCGCYQPNQSCYVCQDDDQPQPETPDEDGGSLLTTMHPDTTRTACSFALVASVVTLVILGASGCRDFEAYVAVSILAVMAAFIGTTTDA